MPEPLLYALRPDDTAIWLPYPLASRLGVGRGQKLTAAQFDDSELQRLLVNRVQEQKARGKGNAGD